NVPLSDWLPQLLSWFQFEDADDFYAAVGFGGVSLTQISGRIVTSIHRAEKEDEAARLLENETLVQAPATPAVGHTIKVLGTSDLLTTLARCCRPVPGDSIIGYVTRARGVTIHRADCVNVTNSSETE